MTRTLNRKIKTYDELITLSTFKERLEYLKEDGQVGFETFGPDRYINQEFYKNPIWLEVRDKVISRDLGCDLGLEGYDIFGTVIVHHMNPIKVDDIVNLTEYAIDPKYLITVSVTTHKVIHYGNTNFLVKDPIIRTKNDTCPWKR